MLTPEQIELPQSTDDGWSGKEWASLAPNQSVNFDLLFDRSRQTQTLGPNTTIALEGDPVRFAFRVERGTVRVCLYRRGGHRQITHFAEPGSLLGLAEQDLWCATLEAVDCVVLKLLPKAAIDQHVASHADLQRAVRKLLIDDIKERDQHMITLSVLSASDRVLTFLENFARRSPKKRFSTLPMNRKDIADYLGLSLETVSRAFTALKRKGLIELRDTHMFRLCDERTRISGEMLEAA